MYHSLATFIVPVYSCHASCLFIHAMHLACLSMPCTLPVYPCHMHLSCLSMPCTLPVYPCHASFLFIHAMHLSCLSMPCIWWLFIQAILLFMLCIYHVSRLSTMQHTKNSFRHSWLFPFFVEWLQVSSIVYPLVQRMPVFTLHCQLTCYISNTQPHMTSVYNGNSFFYSSMQHALNNAS